MRRLLECYNPKNKALDKDKILEDGPGGAYGALFNWDSFAIYDAVKKDPILFYQLKDALQIDDAYRALQGYQVNFKSLCTLLSKDEETANLIPYDKKNPYMRLFVCGLGAL